MNAVNGAEPTGERFIPELMGGQLIEAEHQARYRFALPYVKGKRVLDAGCGSGWGSRLLVEAGASQVVGIDIDPDAIDQSRSRTSEAEFIEADLQQLPFEADSFDVIVCFETLEHTHDASVALDNLVRVLADDGYLFVSSPNPGVYPAGNPFHFQELRPDELYTHVASRLRNVVLFRQHLHLASTLCQDGIGEGMFTCDTYPVTAIAPGNDPYSVAVASNAELPPLRPVQAITASDQLNNLGTLSAALAEEREAINADHARIVAERAQLLQIHDDLNRRLVAAGKELERVVAEVDRLNRLVATANAERDRFALDLVRVEQELATTRLAGRGGAEASGSPMLRDRLDQLVQRNRELEMGMHAIRATLSWRATRPLRGLRKLVARFKSR